MGISPYGAHYYFGHERPVKVQLHVFSNASKDANAAIIYVCSDYADWLITMILVCLQNKNCTYQSSINTAYGSATDLTLAKLTNPVTKKFTLN